MTDDGLKSAVIALFCEFEIGELCAEDEFLCHLVDALKTQSTTEAFDTFVSYFPDEDLLKKTWPHFWSSLHCSNTDSGSNDDEHDSIASGVGAVADLTGDAGVDCFLEMFPGLSAAQVYSALQQHPDDASAVMFRLMSLHQRRSKTSLVSPGTMGSGLTETDREAIRAYVMKQHVTEGGAASNPRLPPELFQTISKTRYREGAVVTYKGEKV